MKWNLGLYSDCIGLCRVLGFILPPVFCGFPRSGLLLGKPHDKDCGVLVLHWGLIVGNPHVGRCKNCGLSRLPKVCYARKDYSKGSWWVLVFLARTKILTLKCVVFS